MAFVALMVLACSKPEISQKPAAPSAPEPQAVSQAPQAPADTPPAAAQPATGQPEGGPAAAVPASNKVYVCEMGCEVVDHPGKCSKCGMTLKEVNRADISYVCETCGFKSDKPGACPKDHTILVLKIQEHKG
jgi:primosomal protein N'